METAGGGPPSGDGEAGGGSLASRIDAMMAAGSFEDDDPADDSDDPGDAGTGSAATKPSEAAAPERGEPEEPDEPDEPDEVEEVSEVGEEIVELDAVEELSADDLAVVPEPPRPVMPPIAARPRPPMPPPPPLPRGMPPVPPIRVPSIPAPPAGARPVVRVPPLSPVAPPPIAPPPPSVEADAAPAMGVGSDAAIPIELDAVDSMDVESVDVEAVESVDSVEVALDDAAPAAAAVAAAELPLEHQLATPTALEQALTVVGEAAHERRAEELARDVEAATDKAQVAALAYELGELYERRLADEARAVKAFGRALASDPSLRPNLWAIRRIFYRRGLWPNLLKLVDAEIRFARTDPERADVLYEKGVLLRDRLDQPAEARAAFEEAHRLDERALPPLVALERMALAGGDLAWAAELWVALAAASRNPERKVTFLLDLIRFHATDLSPEGLERARELVAEAVAVGADADRVAAERLRVAELSGEPDELLAALEAQVALTWAQGGPSGPSETPALAAGTGEALDRAATLRLRVAALRRRQAQVARAAGRAEKAWDYLQQGLAVVPGRPLLIADLADLAEELGRFDELAELVQSWQALEGDPSRALTLSLRRADALLRGGQRDEARALLASLEASAPGFLPLTALVERDALAHGDWLALAGAWTRAADAARLGNLLGPGDAAAPGDGDRGPGDAALAASMYVAAAEVWAHEVTAIDPERGDAEARACLGQALEVVRGYPPAIEALVDLHERLGRVDDAAAVLELQAESGDVDHRVQILARLARLYRDHGLLEQALGAELRLRRLLPDDIRLMWQVDVTLSQLGRPEERIPNLQAIAGRDPDPARKGIALSTAARLAEDVGDRDRAIDLYRQVLAVWPADRYARAALVELLRAQEHWEDLVAQRRAEALELADGPGMVRALREAAWVLEERLGRPADAAGVYRELLDREPTEAAALDGLIRCRAAAGDAIGLVGALEARLETLASADDVAPATLAGAAVALAMAHEQAGRVDDAVDAYRRALAVPDVGVAAGAAASLSGLALADVAQARGDTVARVEAYEALIDATTAPRIKAALHEDLGWLYALVLEDFERAAEAFAAAAVADPARRGPQLGALLVAGRRDDADAQRAAVLALADSATMPRGGGGAAPARRAASPSWPATPPARSARSSGLGRSRPTTSARSWSPPSGRRPRRRRPPTAPTPPRRSISCWRAPRCSRCAAR
ncbi:MAG: hypothetical protein H6709_03440 [Kofleriaceae bacterium]|nr:hypothetical protein [Kofleriaceae bacterium]